MYGIRAGPLVMAVMTVILLLYAVLFAAQGRVVLTMITFLSASACATYVVRVYARAAAVRRARELERERAFVERVGRRRREHRGM